MPMSNSREFVVKLGHVLLLLLLLMLLLAPQRPALKIDSQARERLETHANSHILVPEHELDYYLFKDVRRNITLDLEEDSSMSITVTPCASKITWTWTAIYGRRKGYDFIGRQRASLKSSDDLHQYTGYRRETFEQMHAPAGRYSVSVISLDSDSHVKIFITLNRKTIYPELPHDARVTAQSRKRTLSIGWLEAPSVNSLLGTPEYCLAISRLKNFPSRCAALAYLHGDAPPPKLVSWGFAHEERRNQELRAKANPIKRAGRKMISYTCVGNQTSFTHRKARRGKQYFVDVFIVYKDSNYTSAYAGTTVKVAKRKKTNMKMRVGETKTINLKRKSGMELKLNSTVSRLVFEVIPCAGKIPFELYYNGKLLRRKTMSRRWKRHFIRSAAPGTYLMTFPVKKKKKKKNFVTVSIAANPRRSRISLPENLKILVYDRLTTCSNVTMAWMGTSIEQNYCVYKKKLEKRKREPWRKRCLCREQRPVSEREACTSFSATDMTRQTMTYNVTGLEPSTWYRLDVYVSRGSSASVPLKSVNVKTKGRCQS